MLLLSNEIWRSVPGYERRYEVSNLGRVRSLNFNNSGINKLLSISTIDGYNVVTLFDKNRRRKQLKVHRLVAMAFIPNPDNKPCVDHINGIRSDNGLENLRWATHKENINNPITKIRKSLAQTNNPSRTKALMNNPKISKPILQIDKNTGETIREFPSTQEIKRTLGHNVAHISACARGDRNCKSAYGYFWRYK